MIPQNCGSIRWQPKQKKPKNERKPLRFPEENAEVFRYFVFSKKEHRTKAPSVEGAVSEADWGEPAALPYREIHILPGNSGRYPDYKSEELLSPYIPIRRCVLHQLLSDRPDNGRRHPAQPQVSLLRSKSLRYNCQLLFVAENVQDMCGETHTIVFAPMVSYSYEVLLPMGCSFCCILS